MRLRGIGPEVLLLCFLVVGAAAFALGRRTARGRRLRRDLDYFTGLDHLVNDRYDRATEVFTRLATKSHDADIQFALGSLMRKRGEVDRAIAIHMRAACSTARSPIREQATLALGLDYMSAGLLDRAEEKLRNLLGSPTLSRRPRSKSCRGSTSSSTTGARRSMSGASCRRSCSASARPSRLTTAASSARPRWRRRDRCRHART